MTGYAGEREHEEERALDCAEDAQLRHRIGETGPWPPWAQSSAEQRDERFLEQEAAVAKPDPWDAEEDGAA